MLHILPYDVLLLIAESLDPDDLSRLQKTSKSLYQFTISRPVYRHQAWKLLYRCTPLPLRHFQPVAEFSTSELKEAVNVAFNRETAWVRRPPRLSTNVSGLSEEKKADFILARNQDVDYTNNIFWLTPVSSKYILCAFSDGTVVCWDIFSDEKVVEWSPNDEHWVLCKGRVEHDQRKLWFVASHVSSHRDNSASPRRDFIIIQIDFCSDTPIVSQVGQFSLAGAAISIFLLNPNTYTLCALAWNTSDVQLDLFYLPNWNEPCWTYINTGVDGRSSEHFGMSRWHTACNAVCMPGEENELIIHIEKHDGVYRHVYPIPLLQEHYQSSQTINYVARPSAALPPTKTVICRFADSNDDAPFPAPQWSRLTHFIRQWWPALPDMRALSSTTAVLTTINPSTGADQFVLSQYYLPIPYQETIADPRPIEGSNIVNGMSIVQHYMDEPFCVVAIQDVNDAGDVIRRRPLLAVDFGMVVWLEYTEEEGSDLEALILRMAVFPPVDLESGPGKIVKSTLEWPEGAPLPRDGDIRTINLDQSQGMVFMSFRGGKILAVKYE